MFLGKLPSVPSGPVPTGWSGAVPLLYPVSERSRCKRIETQNRNELARIPLKYATAYDKPQSAMADAPVEKKVELTMAAFRLYLCRVRRVREALCINASTHPDSMMALPSKRVSKQRETL